MNNDTKVQWCNDPISSLISIGELLRDSSFICGELAIQKQPLPLNDERILNDWEEPNEFCAQVMIQKKVWAHPKSIEDGMLWSVFIHHPLMRLAMMNVFKLNEFHWNHRPKAFHPVCFSSALHSSGPACYPTLNQSFFSALYASSPLLHPSTRFIPLFHSTFTSSIHLSCSAWVGCRLVLITIEKRRHHDKYCAQEEHAAQERKTSAF